MESDLFKLVSVKQNKNRSKDEIIGIIADKITEIDSLNKFGSEIVIYERMSEEFKSSLIMVIPNIDLVIPELSYLPSIIEYFYDSGFSIYKNGIIDSEYGKFPYVIISWDD